MNRLFINLEICTKCKECVVNCSYFYHPQNNGITNLREFATFVLICRHCEDAPCVNSCYHHALEKQKDGILKRYRMRCTSCKSCSIACPFGVILPDFIPYLDSRCDFCIGISNKLLECVNSCPYKAIEFKEVEEKPEENIFLIGDKLAVKSRKWTKEDLVQKK
ncbi:MAG: 4Fe-4S binding protein [Candidatus Omnitrophica bacterium]|nr:4Fe-4S binding protein [Candidatus Omnitrophota bacterium]